MWMCMMRPLSVLIQQPILHVAVSAGDGSWAVLAGLIGSAHSRPHLQAHLLHRLPELLEMILSLEMIHCVGTTCAMHLQHGCNHLMVSHQSLVSCVAALHAFTPRFWCIIRLILHFCATGSVRTRDSAKVIYTDLQTREVHST